MDFYSAPFTRKMKQKLSLNIGKDVKRLGGMLGFSEPQLQHLDQKDLYEFSFQMLTKWEQKQGIVAPVGKIIDSLKFLERYDLLHLICPKEFPEFNCPNIYADFVNVHNQHKGNVLFADRSIFNKLELKLKQNFTDIQLPQPQWTTKILPLDELYVDMEMFKVDKYGNESKGVQTVLQHLFHTEKNILPKRILVEGSPGFGKTTFALKLLFDWVAEEDYLSQFRAVFSIALSNFNGYESLEVALLEIMAQANGCSDNENILCLEQYQEEILLILDGYDELHDEQTSKILPLLTRDKYQDMFVILTSRRGLVKFELDTNHDSEQLQLGISRTYVWNRRILLKGISEMNRLEYIKRYFEDDDSLVKKTMQIYEKASSDIYECPLFLMLLVSMSSDEEFIAEINSRTSLYKNVFNFIMRYGLTRGTMVYSHERVEIFNLPSSETLPFYAQHFIKFGKLALKCLIENDLLVTEKELLKCSNSDDYFLCLGIFKKNLIFRHRNRIQVFEPTHKTFYEFSAAFYLFHLLTKQSSRFHSTITSCVEKGFGLNTESLVFPFLGGLLNERTQILFKTLSPWAPIFPDHSEWTLSILREVDNMESIVAELLAFIPPLFNMNVLHVNGERFLMKFIQLLQNIKSLSIIKMLKMNMEVLLKVNRYCLFHIDKIMLQVEHHKDIVQPNFQRSNISCDDLILHCEVDHLNEFEWDIIFLTICSVNSKQRSLTITCNDKSLKNFHECCKKQENQKLIFHDFTIYISKLHEQNCEILIDLIKTKISNGIFIILDSATEYLLQHVVHAFASSAMQEFGLYRNHTSSENILLNLADIIENDIKSKHSLRLRGIQLIPNKTKNLWTIKETSVHCVPPKQGLEILQQLKKVEYVNCSTETFNLLVKHNWSSLQTLTEITLNSADKLNNLFKLNNLTVLTLNVFCQFTIQIETMVQLITNSTLQRLDLVDIRNDSFLTSILNEWLNKVEQNKTSVTDIQHQLKPFPNIECNHKVFKELVLEFCASVNLPDNNFTECFPLLRKLLKKNSLLKFTAFTFIGGINFNASLFPLSSNFKMSREIRGITTNSSRMQHHRNNIQVNLISYREGVSIVYQNDLTA